MLTAVDRQQIAETLARHAFVADENLLDQLGEVFIPEATYDMTRSGMGAFHGIEALSAAAGQMFASGFAPLSHFVTNIVITETGESTASVRSKGLMIMHDGALHAVVYDDTVALHEGRWLIASRVISPIHAAAVDEH
ncbi:nuclear transport factor 2 family protein [Microbacterium halotolerans]|uniref:nuclear transport factor 2 family protein n=1 Tax=Microbacterium halotolerans TaxID=246613 RepID=UPI000E6AAA82|nr:nuclear transport factor 2 family protein [Microbacterium halotolerans]